MWSSHREAGSDDAEEQKMEAEMVGGRKTTVVHRGWERCLARRVIDHCGCIEASPVPHH